MNSSPSAAASPPSSLISRLWRGELPARWLAVTMNLPSIFFLVLVLAYPIYYAGYLSLHKVGMMQMRTGRFGFIGLENYSRLLEDPLFLLAMKNTLVFTAVVVPAELVISVLVALMINQQHIWLSRVSRVLVLVPYAIPPIASGLIWSFVYNVKFGYLNRLLHSMGLVDSYVDWVGNPDTALFMVAIAYIWRTVPFSILLVHAALQGIPQELFEASHVDGASRMRTLWHVTLPLLRPIIVVTLILRTTFSIMVFDEILAITQGGPGDATWIAAWFTYKTTFEPPFNIGMGAASAYILAMVIALFAIFYVKFLYRRVTM